MSASPYLDWSAPPVADLDAQVSGFTVKRLLGVGGMGAVYLAGHDRWKKDVALKILPAEFGNDPNFASRFRREAVAMSRLVHSNIVQIYDYGELANGGVYFSMEYAEGCTLFSLLHEQGVNTEWACYFAEKIAKALQYAHDSKFVHRDIKPANILISSAGKLKVTDFGLVKLLPESEEYATPTFNLTRTNVMMGTPDYIAPEHFDPTWTIDQRADIYSLGVVFYEMLTGTIPRGAFSAPSQFLEGDTRFDEIIVKCLQQNPEARHPDADSFLTSLDMAVSSKVAPKRKSRTPSAQANQRPPKTKKGRKTRRYAGSSKWDLIMALILAVFIVVGSTIAALLWLF